MSPLLTRLNRRVPWRRAGYLRIRPSHQTQLKMRRQPPPSRRIPCRLPNRKARKSLSLRLPLRPNRKQSLRNRLRNPRNLMPGPRTHGRLPIRCWSTSTASAHPRQSNCRVLRAMLSIEADSSSAILPMIQMMSVQRQRRFSMASMWIRASSAAAASRTTVPMPAKPLQRPVMSVRWTKLPISLRPWSETVRSTGAISARPSMAILPLA